MPVLTVNEETGGVYDNLPFSFERTGKNDPLRIFIADDTPGGSGASIRSSLWLAAVTAAMYRKDPMNGVRITLEFSGDVDGPSAGGIMCLSVLSAMSGRELPKDFAMTGTIMPDGTVGMVGGVAQKVEAAIKRGCRRICIPCFPRFERQNDGEFVDLYRIGEDKNVVIKPVRNIDEAFSYLYGLSMTGKAVDEFEICRIPRNLEKFFADDFIKNVTKIHAVKEGLNEEWVKILGNDEKYNKMLKTDDCLQRYIDGRFVSARGESKIKSIFWSVVPSWIESIQDLFKRNPVLSENAPYSDDVRKRMYKALKQLSEKFEYSASSNVVADAFSAGYMRGSADISEIAAQCKASDELSEIQGILHFLALRTRADYEGYDESKDKDAALSYLAELEYWKLFIMKVVKSSLAAAEDVELQKEVSRCYADVRPSSDLGRVERLFNSAWRSLDFALTADVLNNLANQAETTSEKTSGALMVLDMHYSVYLFGKQSALAAHQKTERQKELKDPRYHTAITLMRNARMLASACTLLVKYGSDCGGDIGEDLAYSSKNPQFINYLIRRARESALASISECVRAGVPCIDALYCFETAECKSPVGISAEDLIHSVLQNYWAADLSAKAVMMGFTVDK
jgi:hypothetical protein